MAFTITDPVIGYPIITDTGTVKKIPLGTVVRATDPTYGAGEFIYLLGVANTVAGLAVSYNATTFQTTVLASTANLACPVAWAMSANVASQYGWYQIEGLIPALKTAVKADPAVNAQRIYISATIGRVMQTSVAGKCLMGAARANLTTVTSTTSTVVLSINRPHVQGPIT
jgi:hypothetical protein